MARLDQHCANTARSKRPEGDGALAPFFSCVGSSLCSNKWTTSVLTLVLHGAPLELVSVSMASSSMKGLSFSACFDCMAQLLNGGTSVLKKADSIKQAFPRGVGGKHAVWKRHIKRSIRQETELNLIRLLF